MKVSLIILYVVLALFVIYGTFAYVNPYLISKTETVTGVDTWMEGSIQEAYFHFNLSSDAFITANHPVVVHVKVVIFNPELIPIINSKQYPAIVIINSEYSPKQFSDNGLPKTGTIILTFDGNRTYEGERTLIFPFMGTNYDYTFVTLNSEKDCQFIYVQNKTSPTASATPPINIEEGYSARASYEQANQSNGISFAAFGIAGIALVAYYQFEIDNGKKSTNTELEKEIRKLSDNIEKLQKAIKRREGD